MATDATTIELGVDGMHCASCVRHVEDRLNELDGVQASVNFATARAAVEYDRARVSAGQLVDAVAAAGYGARLPGATAEAEAVGDDAGAGERSLDVRLLVSAILALPLLVLAMVEPLQFDGWQWLSLALATVIVGWAGWPVHRSAAQSLRHGTATMDTLISLGTLAAWGWSVVALLAGGAGEIGMRMPFELVPSRDDALQKIYFEVAGVVMTLILAGRWLEARARSRAGEALRALAQMGAKDAAVLDAGGRERRVPIELLRAGERFVVRPGERIATDGVVEEGASAVDESLISGESLPVSKSAGDEVIGASINASGRLVVRATKVGADTALAQITRLVEQAQTGKAPVQRLADRISAIFVPVVLVLASGALVAWLIAGAGAGFAISAAVAALIVACPCALGLATPTALLVGSGRGAQLGLLISGPEVLESTRAIDTIALDKTGTVTAGELSLRDVVTAPGTERREALALAGALEAASEHPIAAAIAAAARDELGELPGVEAFESHAGLGVEGDVAGKAVVVGRPQLLERAGIAMPAELEHARLDAERDGNTVVAAGWDGAARALFAVSDRIKPSSREAVRRLRALGLRPLLLTGDNETTARAIAREAGIDDVAAELTPAGKERIVRDLQREGRVVAMVGDGVNDAPALARADLGIAIGTGTDVAIAASDLTLVRGDLRAAADAIRLARRTLRTIKQNLFWAFAYNTVLIPVAMLGLLNPILAGAAMAASSLFVLSNSLRLRRFRAA